MHGLAGSQAAGGLEAIDRAIDAPLLRAGGEHVHRAAAGGRWLDADGSEIEDFGLRDNLMIDCALRDGGVPLVIDQDKLSGFEACLRAARAHFGAIS